MSEKGCKVVMRMLVVRPSDRSGMTVLFFNRKPAMPKGQPVSNALNQPNLKWQGAQFCWN